MAYCLTQSFCFCLQISHLLLQNLHLFVGHFPLTLQRSCRRLTGVQLHHLLGQQCSFHLNSKQKEKSRSTTATKRRYKLKNVLFSSHCTAPLVDKKFKVVFLLSRLFQQFPFTSWYGECDCGDWHRAHTGVTLALNIGWSSVLSPMFNMLSFCQKAQQEEDIKNFVTRTEHCRKDTISCYAAKMSSSLQQAAPSKQQFV